MMTVEQACKVNDLCDFLLGNRPIAGWPEAVSSTSEPRKVTEAQAKNALSFLAEQADRKLHAGWTAADVRNFWRDGVQGNAGRFRKAAR
jgi:hypothetical protein